MPTERLVFNFKAPEGASRCRSCGASGPVGVADADSCPWCDGSELPADAVRVTTSPGEGSHDLGHGATATVGAGARIVGRIEVRPQGKAARRVSRGRR